MYHAAGVGTKNNLGPLEAAQWSYRVMLLLPPTKALAEYRQLLAACTPGNSQVLFWLVINLLTELPLISDS